jgi:trehalose 6-phosphate synthase/phosphatase
MRPNIIIVANRLPFSIQESPDGLIYQPSPGGMAAALAPVREHYDASWVGWAGLERPLLAAERQALALPSYAHVVDIPTAAYHSYYNQVANGSLWPILHGFAPHHMYSVTDWQSNLTVNQQFASRIVQAAQPKDIIWIHDFHLIMLPGLLRQAGLKNRIGFFLHVPVASPRHFYTLPHCQDMLRSLQATDVCGVQTKRDAANLRECFATFGIAPPAIKHFPVGIDYELFNKPPDHPAVEQNNKTLILSVSRLDYTKGIIQQLQAIDALLNGEPNRDILYKLIVAPSREALTEYRDLKNAVNSLVEGINGRHPGAVAYSYHNFTMDELKAWYSRADIMLVTPLIDGMNLVAKEYIAARQRPGALILGGQAGAAAQLPQALLVNPTDIQSIHAALQKALSMPSSECHKRYHAMRQNVVQEDVFAWAKAFIEALEPA